jgi:hypothetical protein
VGLVARRLRHARCRNRPGAGLADGLWPESALALSTRRDLGSPGRRPGWATAGGVAPGRGAGALTNFPRQRGAGRRGRSEPDTGRLGTAGGSSCHEVHAVSPAGSARRAPTRAPSQAPGYQPSRAGGMPQKLRRGRRTAAARPAERGVALRWMCEDEARFGRRLDPRRAGAAPGGRPLVATRIEGEDGYA